MDKHTLKIYDEELALLDEKIAQMGGLAEHQFDQSVNALERRDLKLAEEVVTSDAPSTSFSVRSWSRSSPWSRDANVAVDLRHLIGALQITTELERIGDLAKNIAKRALTIADEPRPKPLMSGIRKMAELALTQLREVLEAYAERDAEKALAVWRHDAQIDATYNSLFRELLTYMMEDPRNIGMSTHLLFGAKNIERAGDHTTNIAETIHFLVRGSNIADDRPKDDRTSSTLI